jgi:hypothetical protein
VEWLHSIAFAGGAGESSAAFFEMKFLSARFGFVKQYFLDAEHSSP